MVLSKPVLAYWDIRGLVQPIRFLLAYIGTDYEDKALSSDNRDEWFNQKFSLGLDFPNLPNWIEGDVKLTETKAILKYLAREKGQGLMPETCQEKRNGDMLESVLWDIWNAIIKFCYQYNDEVRDEFFANAPIRLGQVSAFLGKKKFSLRDEICYLDFILYEILYHVNAIDEKILKPFSNLLDFMKRFESIPKIAEYINSSPNYRKGPCFSASAIYKI